MTTRVTKEIKCSEKNGSWRFCLAAEQKYNQQYSVAEIDHMNWKEMLMVNSFEDFPSTPTVWVDNLPVIKIFPQPTKKIYGISADPKIRSVKHTFHSPQSTFDELNSCMRV